MAGVGMQTLWLNDAADLADVMAFPTMSGLVAGKENRADVRTYAGGRTRLISRAGTPRSAKATLPLLTRAQIDWLDDHAGRLVLIRDAQGRKFYGVYLNPTFTEIGYIDEANTELVLVEVSHSEAV